MVNAVLKTKVHNMFNQLKTIELGGKNYDASNEK